MKKNTKEAFTLAEVLMVIAIIGAVAVLAVPNLKTGISEDTNIAKLKATYNQLETAINAVVADYGSVKDADDSCTSSTNLSCFNDLLANKLDLQLNCGTTPARCISSEKFIDVNGEVVSNSGLDCNYAFILSNGATICYRDQNFKYDIDVDGPKKGPNRRGIDIFTTSFDNENKDNLCAEDCCGSGSINYRRNDGSFEKDYDATAWAMTFGNMDYVKCANQLKWYSKTTCD